MEKPELELANILLAKLEGLRTLDGLIKD